MMFASQTIEDLPRDDVRNASPLFRLGKILLSKPLLTFGHIPEPEFDLKALVRLGSATGD
jgi:hypothetical protein